MRSQYKLPLAARKRRKLSHTRISCESNSCPEIRNKHGMNPVFLHQQQQQQQQQEQQYYYTYPPSTPDTAPRRSAPSSSSGEQSNCCEGMQCLDEECKKLIYDYCQACIEHEQTCDIAGCDGSAHCDECCDEPHCTEQCSGSNSETQVTILPFPLPFLY